MPKLPKGMILEEDLVAQEFDLEAITGRDFSEDQMLVNRIGDAIVDYTVKRVNAKKGIGGQNLRSPYSKEYQKSTEFELYGKTKDNVNMQLTGDMIDSIETLDVDDSILVVGIDNENAPKAHGHMTGKNGTVKNMKRQFFGLTVDELKEVLKEFKSEIKDLPKKRNTLGDISPSEERDIQSIGRVGDLFTFEEEA